MTPDLREPGQHRVDSPVICNLTRFRLRSTRHLADAYRDYRRVLEDAQTRGTPGLVRSAFLVENPRTFYNLSIWSDEGAIARFGTEVQAHVDVAGRILGRLSFDPERGPELWSTKWRLAYVSHNLNWDEFDLRAMIRAA